MRKRVRLENWKPVVGFPHYFVSDLGRIRSEKPYSDSRRRIYPIIMKPNKANSVVLVRDGEQHSLKLPRLVLTAFVGDPVPGFDLARHLDDDHTNNKLSNLAWGSYQDNYEDGVRNGKHGSGTPGAKKRGDALRGKRRTNAVRIKISLTKKCYPERQYTKHPRGEDGRFKKL